MVSIVPPSPRTLIAVAIRFAIGWLLTAVLSTAAVWLLDGLAGLDWARTGKLFIDCALALFGFVLSKYWIFR